MFTQVTDSFKASISLSFFRPLSRDVFRSLKIFVLIFCTCVFSFSSLIQPIVWTFKNARTSFLPKKFQISCKGWIPFPYIHAMFSMTYLLFLLLCKQRVFSPRAILPFNSCKLVQPITQLEIATRPFQCSYLKPIIEFAQSYIHQLTTRPK